MNSTQLYDELCKGPTSAQPCLRNSIYDRLSTSPHKSADPIQAKEHTYYTLSPAYCTPSSNEQKIFEDFEEKRFPKLCHNDIV